MNTEHRAQKLSLQEYAALVDQAKARVLVLRREASRDFWRAVGRGFRRAARALRQSLQVNNHLKT